MHRAQCVEACLKTFAALLNTPLLSSPLVVLLVESSILKAFDVPFTVQFGYKNSNVKLFSQPWVWLESPELQLTDIGMNTVTDKIKILGKSFGFSAGASDVTYTSETQGAIYTPRKKYLLKDLITKVDEMQKAGVKVFMSKLEPDNQAAIAAALQLANDPTSRIAFQGVHSRLTK